MTRRWLLLGVIIALSACRTLPQDNARKKSVAERQAELVAFVNWQATGRIALSSDTEAVSAALAWQQRSDEYQLQLTAALGRGLSIEQGIDSAKMQVTGRGMRSGPSAEALLFEELRLRVPLSQLQLWLRGLPGEQAEGFYDPFGRLKLLRYVAPDQIQWRAEFNRYQQLGELDLPSLIDVEGGDYRIRVVVSEWQALEAETVDGDDKADGPTRLQIPGRS